MADEHNYQQGQSDAQHGKGPAAPNSFDNSQARESYNAGYNSGKK